jgi:predicted lipoprotein with Yx(FWY)xxD motif
VLTNAGSFTLYRFALDSASKSPCDGTCAVYWPSLSRAPRAGAGVTGKLGTIKRSDGSLQATYDGYPLFTYIGGSAPGRASGNWVYLNGGLWYEVAVSRTSWLPRRPYGRSLGSGAHKREQRAVIMPWEAQVERA